MKGRSISRRLKGGQHSATASKKYWNKRGNIGQYAKQAWKQRPDGPFSMKRKRYYRKNIRPSYFGGR